MSFTKKYAALAFATAGLIAAAAIRSTPPVSAAAVTDPPPASIEFYNQKVKPIFETNCYSCHGGENHRGGLSIATKAGLLKGGHDGAVIVPGHADQSLLVKLIRHEGPADDPMPMPPKKKISDEDIATVTQWIQAGAIMPE